MTDRQHPHTYTGLDVAVVIPTMARPAKLGKLLTSIAGQTTACGRVIVVDGASSAANVVADFQAQLPIEYYRSPIPGQIQQRNLGISKLRDDNRLIGFLDDDLVLEPDTIEEVISLWNSVDVDTAGVGFNMVNVPRHRYSRIKGLFLLDYPRMGRVLKSGMNTGINNVTDDFATQWLGGGYTLWRREILAEYPQETLNTRWAVGEDLRYSYPIGKKYPLFVCCWARVHHHHVYDQAQADKVARYRGNKIACATINFVLSHRELSLIACCWMLLGLSLGRFGQGLLGRDRHAMKEACGQFEGLLASLRYAMGARPLRCLLEDE